jgi:hypothetical protein
VPTIDERQLPADFRGMLPRAYDRRVTPRLGVIVDRRGANRKFAAELQAMRARLAQVTER